MEPNPFEVTSLPPQPKPTKWDDTSDNASITHRFVAKLIDGAINFGVGLPVMVFTGYWERMMRSAVGLIELAAWAIISFGIYLLLHGFLLATRGQTIGKLVLGIRIVDIDTNQVIPLVKQLLLRDLLIRVLVGIPFIGGIIGLVDSLLIFRWDRRCLHDHLANTKVIFARTDRDL